MRVFEAGNCSVVTWADSAIQDIRGKEPRESGMKKFILFSNASALALYLMMGLVDFGEAAGKGGGGKPPPTDSQSKPVIVFQSGSNIVLADEDGGNRTIVYSSLNNSLSPPSWCSPDGTDIVFPDVIGGQPGIYRLQVVQIDSSGKRTIEGGVPELVIGIAGGDPRCSPIPVGPVGNEEIKVAFGGSDGSLYVVDLDGSNMTLLLDGQQRGRNQDSPDWSPLGDQIVFRSRPLNAQGQRDLEIVDLAWNNAGQVVVNCCTSLIQDVNGSGLRNMDDISSRPKWSPSGHLIAVSSTLTNTVSLWTIPLSNFALAEQVPYVRIEDVVRGMASWSPDSTRLIYIRNPRRGMCGEGDSQKIKGTAIAVSHVDGTSINGCDEMAIIKGGNGWPDLVGLYPDWWRGPQ